MPIETPLFTTDDVKIVKRKKAYDGFFKVEQLSLKHRLFKGGWSDTLNRELFRRGDAVAGILYDPVTDCIGLLEQFRVGALLESTGPWCLEVVAGMIGPGEFPEDVMRRELKEEAGLEAQALLPICEYLSTPGGCDERVHLYCIKCDLNQAQGIYGLDSEGEDIRVRVFSASEVFDAMLGGRLNNAATLIALMWLQLHHGDLRKAKVN